MNIFEQMEDPWPRLLLQKGLQDRRLNLKVRDKDWYAFHFYSLRYQVLFRTDESPNPA